MPSKTAQDVARDLLDNISVVHHGLNDLEMDREQDREFLVFNWSPKIQSFAEEYHKQNTPVVSQDAEDAYREFVKIQNDYWDDKIDIKEKKRRVKSLIQSFADSQNAKLREAIKKLRKTIDWYANWRNWDCNRIYDDMSSANTSNGAIQCGGRRARAALEAEHGD